MISSVKIKQVEELVGITSKNIRFYESQGLLTPERADNGYREYHQDNIQRKKSRAPPTLFSTNYDFYPFTAPTTRLSCTCLLKKK